MASNSSTWAMVVTGHHHRDLEAFETRVVQVLHCLLSDLEGALATDRVVGRGVCPVYRDLHVHVVHGGELSRRPRRRSVSRSLRT